MQLALKVNKLVLNLLNAYTMIIELDQGKIQGIQTKSYTTGRHYNMFLGIPYAKPPINELRFQNPVPFDKWEGIYNATNEGEDCVQYLFGSEDISGSEDCLYLNVYTPELPSESNPRLPTMVYIHGGAFAMGDGSRKLYTPDFLINYDVILVTFNYRLHALGFMNMGIPECTGNFGLKDQALALKWVKNNIAKFGGDPNNITIFGESAGASSVHYHMVSPLSANLFQKAILQSGFSWSPWAFIPNPEEMGFKLARFLGYEGNDKVQLVEFLKGKSAEEITEAENTMRFQLKRERIGITSNYLFVPSIELIKDNNAFITDHPGKLPLTGPIQVLTGINEREGFFAFLDSTIDIPDKLHKNISSIISYNFQLNQSLIPLISNTVKQFYFGRKMINKDTSGEVADLFTDLYFLNMYDVIESLIKSNVPVYVYNFAYDGNMNMLKNILVPILPEGTPGASHGDDLGYLFYLSFLDDCLQLKDFKMVDLMCRLWTNFAKTGDPTYDMADLRWKPMTMDHPSYLRISSEPMVMHGKIHEHRFLFWKSLLRSANAVQNRSPF